VYRVKLDSGSYRMKVFCWWIGDHAPVARMTRRGGLILGAKGGYDARLSTDKAQWRVTRHATPGFQNKPRMGWLRAQFDMDLSRPPGDPVEATKVAAGADRNEFGVMKDLWQLVPSEIPDMLEKQHAHIGRIRAVIDGGLEEGRPVEPEHENSPRRSRWQELLEDHNSLTIPPSTKVSVLIDLENYYCGYPRVTVNSGKGARVSCSWSESLYQVSDDPEENDRWKGNRDEVTGKVWDGFGDSFTPAGEGSSVCMPLWWRAGRYLLLTVETQVDPLVIERVELLETRYPLENESRLNCPERDFNGIIDLCTRGLQMCSHETYMDCPHYEQLMYVGDTRLEILTHYQLQHDARLARKAIHYYNASRFYLGGFTASAFPSRGSQCIPTFSMIWVWMLNDYLYWRDDAEFVTGEMEGMRKILHHFEKFLNDDCLLEGMPPWLFVDWVPEWQKGVAPGAYPGPCALVNLIYLNTLQRAEELEEACGSTHFGEYLRELTGIVGPAIMKHFWDDKRNLISDDLEQTSYSEHAQCLAQMSGLMEQETARKNLDALRSADDLHRTTIYFRHYLFETFNLWNMPEEILDRFGFWEDLLQNGLHTPIEKNEPSRSDCHAWGSHPLLHLHTSLMGIRPSVPFYRAVEVVPKLGPLKKMSSRVPHPDGWIEADVDLTGEHDRFVITLPDAIHGELVWNKGVIRLEPGENVLEL
jgi:hypothetical protein